MIIVILTATAFILSIILTVVNALINKEDRRVKEIEDLLPGVNCGACGFGSCKGMALEILKNKDALENCRVLRGEKKDTLVDYLKK